MKTHPFFRSLSYLQLLACGTLCPLAISAQSTWTGAGLNFEDASNWTGTAPSFNSNAANQLVFGDSTNYNIEPNLDFWFSSVTFTRTAPQGYTFSNALYPIWANSSTPAFTHISNNSSHEVTIENDINIYTGASNTRMLVFAANQGDIVWSGNSVNTDAGASIRKAGLQTLTLTGNHTGYLDGETVIGGIRRLELLGGTVRMDIDAGFSIREDLNVHADGRYFSDSGAQWAGSSSALHIIGKNNPLEATTLQLRSYTGNTHGAHRILVDSNGGMGTTLKFTNAITATHLNIVLDANSKIEAPSFSSTPSTTVTVTSPGGVTGTRTGFAVGSGNEIVRHTTFANPLQNGVFSLDNPTNIYSSTAAYRVVGDVGYKRTTWNNGLIASLTIGTDTVGVGGSFAPTLLPPTPVPLTMFNTTALLMEEGVGDYHFDVRVTTSATPNTHRHIHQYSRHGTLYFNAGLEANFTKLGPGTMVVSNTADNTSGHANGGTGYIFVWEGQLIINSAYDRVGAGDSWAPDHFNHGGVRVMGSPDDQDNARAGVLAGAGSLGMGTYGANRWAHVRILRGGTLDGTAQFLDPNDTKKALTIRGQLTFADPDAIYKVSLIQNPGTPLHVLHNANNISSTIVTLNGDLQLDLQYAPLLHDIITLLTWETGYNKSGQFLTINGGSFGGINNNEFSLNYGGNDYDFQLIYGSDSVYLNVIGSPIPEPATVAALFGIALAGLIWRRRMKN